MLNIFHLICNWGTRKVLKNVMHPVIFTALLTWSNIMMTQEIDVQVQCKNQDFRYGLSCFASRSSISERLVQHSLLISMFP